MYYLTVKQHPSYRQMSLEEFMFGNPEPALISMNQACTRTYTMDKAGNPTVWRKYNIINLICKLEQFNAMTDGLMNADRHTLYKSFLIPKKSGGVRKIDAPSDVLMGFQRYLKELIESEFVGADRSGALYHTSAFAYVNGRCTIDAVKRHQQNESKWFAKYDFSNFFGSTTKEFVMHILGMVVPFSEIMRSDRGRCALDRAIDIAFLDGVLPQGTPLSPLITNIMMIPIDFTLANALRDFNKQRFVYTRYADDIIVSSVYDFDFRGMEAKINQVLKEFNAPFKINNKKTRYGSSSGRNWNLGVMLNRENKITIGKKRKKEFVTMIDNFIMDTINGKPWGKENVMILDGLRNYYQMVEGDEITGILNHAGRKFNVNVQKMIKQSLKA